MMLTCGPTHEQPACRVFPQVGMASRFQATWKRVASFVLFQGCHWHPKTLPSVGNLVTREWGRMSILGARAAFLNKSVNTCACLCAGPRVTDQQGVSEMGRPVFF